MNRRRRSEPPPAEAGDRPPLLLGKISFESLREAPVYLDAHGRVACGDDSQWKRKRYYATQYAFCLEFLNRKGLSPDVSHFRKKGLIDVIEDMDRTKRTTISRDELLEVAHQNNHIAMIKDAILGDTKSALYRYHYPPRRRRPGSGGRRASARRGTSVEGAEKS